MPIEGKFSHIPPNLVVAHWTSAVESSSPLDFLSLRAMWILCGRLLGHKIMSIISVGCDFTTTSGGIWVFSLSSKATNSVASVVFLCSWWGAAVAMGFLLHGDRLSVYGKEAYQQRPAEGISGQA